MTAQRTALIYSDAYLLHDPGPDHPESPERLRVIIRSLDSSGLLQRLTRIEPSPAPEESILRVHSKEYLERVRKACATAPAALDTDTAVSRDSFQTALLAAGGVMSAVDAVMDGRARNAFCAVRPPGHHATRDRAMGFCLFNNIAIATRHIQDRHKLKRVLIVDWDAHHGNGTQDIFYGDPGVFYFSTHQYPCYPGTGAASEKGSGEGKGFTLNVPLPPGTGDEEYIRIFKEILDPAADKFSPEFVLISAGFDPHRDDPITNLGVTARGFAEMTKIVRGIADRHCSGRLVSVLEGGYNLEVLGDSVVAHVKELLK